MAKYQNLNWSEEEILIVSFQSNLMTKNKKFAIIWAVNFSWESSITKSAEPFSRLSSIFRNLHSDRLKISWSAKSRAKIAWRKRTMQQLKMMGLSDPHPHYTLILHRVSISLFFWAKFLLELICILSVRNTALYSIVVSNSRLLKSLENLVN